MQSYLVPKEKGPTQQIIVICTQYAVKDELPLEIFDRIIAFWKSHRIDL